MAAAGGASVDAILADAIAKLDGLNKRMDALETKPGSNNPIKGDDDDDKRDDAKAKSDDDDDKRDDDDDDDDKKDDAATAPKTKILDDAKAAPKADATKADAKVKGDDGELEIKHGKGKDDSAKTDDDDDKKDDAFPPKKKDDSAKTDDDDDKKDDSARADAIVDLRRQIGDTRATIARLEAILKPRSDDEHAAFADAQARADTVFAGFGQRAPRPLDGEALFDYRKRMAKKLKGYSPVWKNAKFSKLDEETFAIAETQVYSDATAAAANPMDLEAGELRMVTKIDPATGVRSNVFYGKESFVKSMGRPGRRVASFRTIASN
jgi:hypothetical protein